MLKKICVVLFFIGIIFSLLQKSFFAFDEPEPFFESRYKKEYSDAFFKLGFDRVTFNSNLHLKIGVIVKNQSLMHIREIIAVIFSVAPFDRYRDFFVFLDDKKIKSGRKLHNFFIEAYDSYGKSIPGGYSLENSSVRAGLLVLNVNDPEFEKTGTLGYARNKLAVAQKITILHELAHVLANLGDEYSVESNVKEKNIKSVAVSCGHNKFKAWNTEKANLDYKHHKYLKWQPLIEQNIIPDKLFIRKQIENGVDIGRFCIPTNRCIMNRIIGESMGFCPVCQLQIIESICRFTGKIPPWEE